MHEVLTKITPKSVWEETHARYAKLLKMPCSLNFSEKTSTASHKFLPALRFSNCKCEITINPKLHFYRPEHLLLHEFAHHRAIANIIKPITEGNNLDSFDLNRVIKSQGKSCCTYGHCEHFAQILLGLYQMTNTALPRSTQFENFAIVAGIDWRKNA